MSVQLLETIVAISRSSACFSNRAQQHKGATLVGTLKVGSDSNPNKVAGALAGTIREQGTAEIQTIGAGALNQAFKGNCYRPRLSRARRASISSAIRHSSTSKLMAMKRTAISGSSSYPK